MIMGILHSTVRFLRCKPEDERPIYPSLDNHSSEKLPKISIFGTLIYKAIKGLLQKFRLIFYFPWLRKKDPILPIKNPESSVSSEPLVIHPAILSWPSDDRSIPETDVSVPEIRCLVAYVSVSEERDEIDPPKVVEEREDEREKERLKIKSIGIRWIKHYSSRHRILLVGDGDFSFSASLALAFQWAPNIIATSLDSNAFLKKNYSKALSNIEELRNRNCKVMHEIDATKMANHPLLGHLKFDRIIFNFPFAGFFTNLTRGAQLRRHRRLVSLFLKNAREMISEDGEIHISHKTNGFHAEFKLELVASSHRLRFIEAVKFDFLDYPGYHTKYGFGGDNNFNCNPSKTFKFGLKGGRGL